MGLAPLIPRRERQLNGLLEVRLPDIIRGPADVGTGEHTMDSRLPGLVAKLREGLQGGALRDNAVVEMSLVKEVVRETPGELPRVPVRLSLGRLRYHRQQRAMFPCEPGHRLRAIGEFVKGHGSMRLIQPDGIAPRVDEGRRAPRGVQVMVVQAHRRGAVVGGVRELGGVAVQQVVQYEAISYRLSNEIGLRQLAKERLDGARRPPCQARGRGGTDLGSWVEAQKPEQPSRGRRDRLEGPGEDRAQIDDGIGTREVLEFAAQAPGEGRQRVLWAEGGAARRDRKR